MINEYALEPGLLNNWPTFRYLSEKFGYGRGRLISRFPKHWERMVYESLEGCKPVEKSRIEEGLRRLKGVLYPRFHEWEDGPWLANAVKEHVKRPFHAIIASANPGGNAFVLNEGELSEETQPLWKVNPQRRINRSAAEIADCARLLLANAREIIFVDPYFRPKESRFVLPLERLLEIIANRPAQVPLTRIEYHMGHTNAGPKQDFEADCQARLPRCIPAGLRVRFVRWDEGYLHNRFILTEKGGLKFSTGMDAAAGKPLSEDIVDLLVDDVFATTWLQYQRNAPVFPLIEDSLVIVGTRRR